MHNIHLVVDLANQATTMAKDIEVAELFDGPRRKIIQIRLRAGATLAKHKANEPITVFCHAGTGVFSAGTDLDNTQKLHAGILITLESGVEHEVVATTDLTLIVTKFKES